MISFGVMLFLLGIRLSFSHSLHPAVFLQIRSIVGEIRSVAWQMRSIVNEIRTNNLKIRFSSINSETCTLFYSSNWIYPNGNTVFSVKPSKIRSIARWKVNIIFYTKNPDEESSGFCYLSHFSKSDAVIGWPEMKPWIASQSIARSNSSCSFVSTPSAVTWKSMDWPNWIMPLINFCIFS